MYLRVYVNIAQLQDSLWLSMSSRKHFSLTRLSLSINVVLCVRFKNRLYVPILFFNPSLITQKNLGNYFQLYVCWFFCCFFLPRHYLNIYQILKVWPVFISKLLLCSRSRYFFLYSPSRTLYQLVNIAQLYVSLSCNRIFPSSVLFYSKDCELRYSQSLIIVITTLLSYTFLIYQVYNGDIAKEHISIFMFIL